MSEKKGALPSQLIKGMMEARQIIGAAEENINPASLDLSLSEEVYRVNGVFQPRPGEKISELVKELGASSHDWNLPLERDVVYIARLNESLQLPDGIYGYCNPKSTTGRSDIHVRILADGIPRYDAVSPAGYKGPLWIAISPKSFPIRFKVGAKLSQIRFFNSNTRFSELDLQIYFEKDKLLWVSGKQLKMSDIKISDGDGSIILTAMISGKNVDWHSLRTNRIADFPGKNPKEHFFEKIDKNGGKIFLRRGEFYLISTREAVRVPPWLACEMVPMDERSGEFRSHYAGYIDPGWGYGAEANGVGSNLTLELRPFEDIIIRNNQPIAKIRFERMVEEPDIHYDDAKSSSSYVGQKETRPSKYFV